MRLIRATIAASAMVVVFALLGFAQSAAAHTIYATKPGEKQVVPIIGSTPQDPIQVDDGAWALAITPDARTVYVIGDENVTPIDAETRTPGEEIEVGSPRGGWRSPRTGRPPTW